MLVVNNDRWSDGDEIHYLLISSSLLKDGDLILDNNYENKDYFFPFCTSMTTWACPSIRLSGNVNFGMLDHFLLWSYRASCFVIV